VLNHNKKFTAAFFLFLLIVFSFSLFAFSLSKANAQANPATNAGTTAITVSPTPPISPIPTPTPAGSLASFLTISPPVRELELPRGSSNSYQVSILNQGGSSVKLVLRASPFTAAGDVGGVNVSDEELTDSQDWVIINPNILTLNPGERREITYTITVPKNAEPGGFYFAITALLAGKSGVSGQPTDVTSGTAVNFNVAALNLITIEGPVSYNAQITEFSTPKVIFEYGPVPLTARIRNLSTVHIKPLLEIDVKNTLGLLSDSETVHIKQQNILPQAQRKFEGEFGGKWHFGRYAATLSGLYGDGQMLTYTLFFWILPWKIILAVILAIAIIILLILSIKRQLDEKKVLEEELKEIKHTDK